MISERLSDSDLASAAHALQADEVAVRPRIVGLVAAVGFLEILCYLAEASFMTMSIVGLIGAGIAVVVRMNAKRFLIAVSGIGLSADEKKALRKELLSDPAVLSRINAAAHGQSLSMAKDLARGARRGS